MAKVIAIIEKPSNCQKCWFSQCRYSTPLSTNRKGYLCQLLKGEKRVVEDFDYDEEVHLKNCPLREVPQKHERGHALKVAIENDCYDDTVQDDAWCEGYDKGYNACIDEILGGGE